MPTKRNRRFPASRSRRKNRFLEGIGTVTDRAKRRTNQKLYRDKRWKWKAAALSGDAPEPDWGLPLPIRLLRWTLAALLCPLCLIVTVAFLRVMSDTDFAVGFITSTPFWYFASGFILMTGWFFTRACHNFFLYAYVWGHEFTHVIFVLISRGRVAEFEVSARGGYIVTNKSNVAIALSPYFFPFWTVMTIVAFTLIEFVVQIPHPDKFLFGLLGFTWSFHVWWTLWMIPRDQPDLKENDTFFSLVLIYLINLIVLSSLVCLASDQVSIRDFLYSWLNIGIAGVAKIREIVSF